MSTAREDLGQLIAQQPDDSSYEDLVRELAFSIMVRRGLKDSDAGHTISNEEMRRRIRTWQERTSWSPAFSTIRSRSCSGTTGIHDGLCPSLEQGRPRGHGRRTRGKRIWRHPAGGSSFDPRSSL